MDEETGILPPLGHGVASAQLAKHRQLGHSTLDGDCLTLSTPAATSVDGTTTASTLMCKRAPKHPIGSG